MSTTKKTKKLSKETRKLIKALIMHEGYKLSMNMPGRVIEAQGRSLVDSASSEVFGELFFVWLGNEKLIGVKEFVSFPDKVQEEYMKEFAKFLNESKLFNIQVPE